jgi:nicotinamidase/pyrazinamidase
MKIAWNVDTQYDFMRPEGKLAIDGAQDIEGNLAALTRTFRQYNTKVVNTADWHNQYSEELSDKPDFMTTFPEHCMANTPGAEYVPATRPENAYVIDWQGDKPDLEKIAANREITIYKDKFDVFAGNPYTDEIVDAIKPDTAFVYGVAENVCVDFAVMGLRERGLEVYVVEDAIKGLDALPSPKQKWLDAGVKLIKTTQIAQYI